MGRERTALPGTKRGRLTFVRFVESGRHVKPQAIFRCDCGTEIEAQVGNWQSGNTKSCGCARGSHRQHNDPIYKCYTNMRTRAKKVGVDPRWVTFEGFAAHPPTAGPSPIDGLERAYEPGLCLCRTGDMGPYSPENCRWDTRPNNSREQVQPTKLTATQWREVAARYAPGELNQYQLATEYGVTQSHISQIIKKQRRNA